MSSAVAVYVLVGLLVYAAGFRHAVTSWWDVLGWGIVAVTWPLWAVLVAWAFVREW